MGSIEITPTLTREQLLLASSRACQTLPSGGLCNVEDCFTKWSPASLGLLAQLTPAHPRAQRFLLMLLFLLVPAQGLSSPHRAVVRREGGPQYLPWNCYRGCSLCMLFPLISFPKACKIGHSHFVSEKTKSQRGQKVCSRSHS